MISILMLAAQLVSGPDQVVGEQGHLTTSQRSL